MERQDRLSQRRSASLSRQKALKINFFVVSIASMLVLMPIIIVAVLKIQAVPAPPTAIAHLIPTRIPTALSPGKFKA